MIYRKLRGDQIEVYKMLNNHYDDEIEIPLKLSANTCRDHSRIKLSKSKITKDIRANFFSNRVVKFWNQLATSIRQAPSIKSFEMILDKYWIKYDIKYDFDKCLDFKRSKTNPNYAGSTPRNLTTSKLEDLELQEF